jgi:hypothetical protein
MLPTMTNLKVLVAPEMVEWLHSHEIAPENPTVSFTLHDGEKEIGKLSASLDNEGTKTLVFTLPIP